jgi:hypothetical protein
MAQGAIVHPAMQYTSRHSPARQGFAAATISRHPEELPMSSRRINPETDATYDLDPAR